MKKFLKITLQKQIGRKYFYLLLLSQYITFQVSYYVIWYAVLMGEWEKLQWEHEHRRTSVSTAIELCSLKIWYMVWYGMCMVYMCMVWYGKQLVLSSDNALTLDQFFTLVLYVEGLAVGVGFGAIGKSPSATLENARYCITILIMIIFLLEWSVGMICQQLLKWYNKLVTFWWRALYTVYIIGMSFLFS